MLRASVSIIVPAYNEEAVIGAFFDAAADHAHADWEIVFVDDGSEDGTASILRDRAANDPRVRVVRHDRNLGLGAAIRSGFAAASGSVYVTMDADLSHPFATVDALIDACDHGADAAFGSRFVPSGGMRGVPLFRRLVSRIGNLVFRLVYWSRVRDMTTGLRAYRSEMIDRIPTTETGFAIQLEIAVRLIAAGATVVEIPLVLRHRAAGESKMRYTSLVPRYFEAFVKLVRVRWFEHSVTSVDGVH